MAPTERRLGIVGAGNLGMALVRGLLKAGWVSPEGLWVSDPDPARRRELEALGVRPAGSNAEVLAALTIILAVKPQMADRVLAELAGAGSDHLFISLVAGLPLARLEEALPFARIMRAMPNTPLMVGEGVTALAPGSRATPEDLALGQELFGALGRAVVVEETHLEAVTGLSGSGPAYVAVFIEALADGGVRMGLPRALALELAAQTVRGTAALLLSQGLHPAVLKDQVASPGGTTIAGLHALEQGGFRGVVMDAVQVATWRARELARR
ncbi:MAG: pyrroline-5-carboxylate reductase [Syntrophobacterales bacterium]|nr:pyrroline-5-carboxylate reductase [Syntrophobacterales bacterium]